MFRFVLLLVALCAIQSVHADPGSAKVSDSPTAIGDKEAREYRKFVDSIQGAQRDEVTEMPSPEVDAAPSLPRVDYVIVRGNEGIAFPDLTRINDEDLYTPTPTPRATSTPWPTATPWQPPKRCKENTTRTVADTEQGDPTKLWYDYLFLYKEFVPLDSTEVYGVQTRLYPYDTSKPEGAHVRMKVYQVPCVPYRIRHTSRTYYYDTGLNALKNYGTDQTGKGKLHPWVAQKLYGDTNKTKQQRKRFRKR